jgi:Spy/CpxP family protein refolding chaperone
MTTTKRLTLLGCLILLVAVLPALAQDPGRGKRPNPVMGIAGPALHQLELTRDVKQQIRGIVDGYMEGELGQRAEAFREARRALELVIWNSDASEMQITDLSQAVAYQSSQLNIVRQQLAGEILQLLTEDQRETFGQLLAEAPQHPEGPGGHGGPGGPGGPRGPGSRGR